VGFLFMLSFKILVPQQNKNMQSNQQTATRFAGRRCEALCI
jgi:hypothetical protein